MFSRHSDRAMRDAEPVPSDLSRNGALSPVPTMPVREAEPAVQAVAMTIGSVVGRDDALDGAIRVRQALRIFGRVTGSIESESSITIEEGAVVEADITATEVTIAGNYSGKLVCRERLEIRPSGFAKGEIETVRLMLHEGGFIDGALKMKRPERPMAPPPPSRPAADAPPAYTRPMETVPVPIGQGGARSFAITAPTSRGMTPSRPIEPVPARSGTR
jgi:cytoskeletal protein CcmA (bactofilin family)